MIDQLTQKAHDSDVSVGVKNVVVLLLWVPPILILWGVGFALFGVGVRVALYGSLPNLAAIGMPVDPTLAGLAVVGGIGYLYLMLANETFGEETVEAATEQAQDIKDNVDESTD
jgi:hypothetical protein